MFFPVKPPFTRDFPLPMVHLLSSKKAKNTFSSGIFAGSWYGARSFHHHSSWNDILTLPFGPMVQTNAQQEPDICRVHPIFLHILQSHVPFNHLPPIKKAPVFRKSHIFRGFLDFFPSMAGEHFLSCDSELVFYWSLPAEESPTLEVTWRKPWY